jgi:hypothetical protein
LKAVLLSRSGFRTPTVDGFQAGVSSWSTPSGPHHDDDTRGISMHSISRWGVLVGAAAITLAPLAPAGAATGPVVTIIQGTIYQGTAPDCTQTTDVSGRYSITIKGDGTAAVSLRMHMDGKLHAAWGGNYWGERFTWARTGTGYVLSLRDWTMTVEGDVMRFDIPDLYEGCDGYVLATVG